MTDVTVMTRQGCHLCEQAEQAVERICGELGVAWTTADVDTNPEWRAEYGDYVPVILIDGVQHGYWRVEEDRFRKALVTAVHQ
ncbi:glutaredoxin family protein [Amycolatopsis alkalitolerans]|uniref:Glutaredoxin family protein n=1 Tax=Amycolatopsis alkalitolerans TaxID=2547244 RepID=A0A5C4M6J4_9PSEU|nr:glutaredoxin family protein [Amycolatopsis alkalitolerans]TNC28561.1 glutaredoxin family protein [Amycolatopsis alkalitolerans]